jgi:hypothetical protein
MYATFTQFFVWCRRPHAFLATTARRFGWALPQKPVRAAHFAAPASEATAPGFYQSDCSVPSRAS